MVYNFQEWKSNKKLCKRIEKSIHESEVVEEIFWARHTRFTNEINTKLPSMLLL